MGRFDRLQSQVERLEARVRSYEVGSVSPSAWESDLQVSDPMIEAELEALKAKNAAPAATAPSVEEAEQEA
jgi:hypothetical protein